MTGTWADFVQSLHEHVCADDRELESKAEMIRALDAGVGISRDVPTHFTGSAFVYSERGVLLHKHLKAGRWFQPGGHIDPGEVPVVTAVRETLEETGLHAVVESALPVHVDTHDAGDHRHLDVRYLLVADSVDPSPPIGESQEVEWFALDDLAGRIEEPLAAALLRIGRGRS